MKYILLILFLASSFVYGQRVRGVDFTDAAKDSIEEWSRSSGFARDSTELVVSDTATVLRSDMSDTAAVLRGEIVDTTLISNIANTLTPTQIESRIASAVDTGAVIMMVGDFSLDEATTTQILVQDKINMKFILDGTVTLADNTQTDGLGAITLLRFEDCDGLTFNGRGSTIDGNGDGQSGWSGGYGPNTSGIAIRVIGSAGDSVDQATIKNIKIHDCLGEAVRTDYTTYLDVNNVVVDSCGEGIVWVYGRSTKVHGNTIKHTYGQDGIEPSYSHWNKIYNNTFLDSTTGGTQIDIFHSTHTEIYDNIFERFDMQMNYSNTNHLYFHDNVCRRQGLAKLGATNIQSSVNHDIRLSSNTFYLDATNFCINVLGDSVYQANIMIDNNVIYLTNDTLSQKAFSVQGDGAGAKFINNTVINPHPKNAATTNYMFTTATSYGHVNANYSLINNIGYNLKQGMWFNADPDSVNIVNNKFIGTHVDSIMHISSGFIDFDVNSHVEGNGVEMAMNTSTFTSVDSVFTPVPGIRTWYLNASVDSIAAGSYPVGIPLTFICRGTVAGDFLYDGKNKYLSGDNSFAVNQNDVITLIKYWTGGKVTNWVEISRSEN